MKNVYNSKEKNNFVTSNVFEIPKEQYEIPKATVKAANVNIPKSDMKSKSKLEKKEKMNRDEEYQLFLKLKNKYNSESNESTPMSEYKANGEHIEEHNKQVMKYKEDQKKVFQKKGEKMLKVSNETLTNQTNHKIR
jgi:hypothetical protein